MKSKIIRSPIHWWIAVAVIVSISALLLTRSIPSVLATDSSPVNSGLSANVMHTGFADLVEAVAPTVVSIHVQKSKLVESSNTMEKFFFNLPEELRNSPYLKFWEDFSPEQMIPHDNRRPRKERRRFGQQVGGSGVIIDTKGYVITNHHVIDDAEQILVTTMDGTSYPAKLVGEDALADLAVLKIESEASFPYVEFGNSEQVRVGDWVVAIGHPFGLTGTVTLGVLSAKARTMPTAAPQVPLIQVDAAINEGNSGGPLFNTAGQVIGLNTLIFSPTGTSVGLNFAVPSEVLKHVSYQLIDNGRVSRGQLGVLIQNITPDMAGILSLEEESQGQWGALVADVYPDSPANNAGIMAGDIVVEYDRKPVDKVVSLQSMVRQTKPGQEVTVVVIRDGEKVALDVKIGDMAGNGEVTVAQDDGDQPSIGIKLSELNPELRAQLDISDGVDGIVVVEVMPGSPAQTAGLRPGDVIHSLDRQTVSSVDQFLGSFEKIAESGSDKVLLHIERNGSKSFTVVDLS
ncbi:MAG: Do family serine endopeptidase [Acidiferrobacterales bacterium]|nr:Do family serine endopeptidase [Acidiferrobacterales bacterium]